MDAHKDDERSEDLNPRSNDIEERVKQMLDPRLPDAAEEPKTKPKKSKEAKAKPITVAAAEPDPTPSSAPVLPTDDPAGSAELKPPSKSKKVIIPITHETAEDEKNDAEAELQPAVKPEAEAATAGLPETAPVTLDLDDGKTAADVAEKLDQTIAELAPADGQPATDEAVLADAQGDQPVADGEQIPVEDPAVLKDPSTDKAVEAIVADESDELLEMEDAVRDSDEVVKPDKKPRRQLRQLLKAWWGKAAVRWATILVLIGLLLAAGAIPSSRYFVLNSLGVRASSSLTVLDDSTQQPLKNVIVSLGKSSAITDVNGKVQLQKVRLGNNVLTVQKPAFAPVTKTIVVGWGSNPLGSFSLMPTGSQYTFTVTDYLSGKPVAKAEASSGESASALSDDKGLIKLTIDQSSDSNLNVTIKADQYRSEQLSLNPNDKTTHAIKLVPARKHVFVSRRSGKYDIYSVYVDGQDEKLVLAGSGKERDDLALVPHPTKNIVAYVSTRAGQADADGYLLSNLLLINIDDNSTTNVGASERIQIVGWSGDRLIYVKIAAGASASNPKRYRLMSYDLDSQSEKELASSNYFNDVVFAGGSVYLAPSSAYQTGPTNFYKINPDGSGSQVIYNQEVWNIFRTAYDHLTLSVQQQWYDYKLGAAQPAKLNAAPANQVTQVYIDNPDGKHSAWVDNRDGKGVLLVYDIGAKTDTTLHSQNGLTYPVYWLSNTVLVYRVKSDTETADYAISLNGGDPVKIRDVTNSAGLDRWYY